MSSGQESDLWVFGYGSLMWRPGFRFLESYPATLNGYHRAFCAYSHHYRGTPERPGLVLGLDRGGACLGRAFRVESDQRDTVVAYLDERELGNYAYRPAFLPVELDRDGTPDTVTAYTFVADPGHPLYAGDLGIERSAALIMNAEGVAGLNRDYLINTVRHLEDLGFIEDELHALRQEVESRTGLLDIGGGI